jgi:excisionase family DNA binding protein
VTEVFIPAELTKKQAAQRKQVSVKTIDRWISEGRIEALRYGPRLVRIRTESLDNLGQVIHPNFAGEVL